MLNDNQQKELQSYIESNVEDFHRRYDFALSRMQSNRSPLYHTDRCLYEEMLDIADEWLCDNGVSVDSIDEELAGIFFI